MKIAIVYESIFGNTHRIASAIERGARATATTRLISVDESVRDALEDADVIIIGAPTHAFSMSTPSSRQEAVRWTHDEKQHVHLDAGEPSIGVREWTNAVTELPGLYAAFDTRIESMRHLPGSAARRIDKRLRSRGLRRLTHPMNFYVSSDNQLEPGEEERAEAWGDAVATLARNALITRAV